jgi:squalene synthase HpnC
MTKTDHTIRAAYAECRRRARRHYENFPVASLLVPREKRDALAAIYAFARYADDVADEPGALSPDMRLSALAQWRLKLKAVYAGTADQAVFVALGDAIARFTLSREHFEDLIKAFELDVRVNRHKDVSSLLDYCSLSANPVGRLVLELFGHRDPDLFALSDCICTALQLTNFWQDVAVDVRRGRVYLPVEDLERFQCTFDDLRSERADGRWVDLMAMEVARTRELFERGRPLAEKVAPELRRQLRLTWLGGMAVLSKLELARYDMFHRRPSLGRLDFLRLYFKARHPLVTDDARARHSALAGRARHP